MLCNTFSTFVKLISVIRKLQMFHKEQRHILKTFYFIYFYFFVKDNKYIIVYYGICSKFPHYFHCKGKYLFFSSTSIAHIVVHILENIHRHNGNGNYITKSHRAQCKYIYSLFKLKDECMCNCHNFPLSIAMLLFISSYLFIIFLIIS